jgi:hypothetical protein
MSRTIAALCLVCFAIGGCRAGRAGDADCEVIVDRIVELELHSRGYRDPELAARRSRELVRLLQPELTQCRGMRLPERAMACVAAARSADEINHDCLR